MLKLHDYSLSLSRNGGIWIAAKYDVAISTACAGLDYIVVDTANTAQACVEMLRSRNLGVATFLILVRAEQQIGSKDGFRQLSCFLYVSLWIKQRNICRIYFWSTVLGFYVFRTSKMGIVRK